MSTASQVSKLYHTVVEDVINNVKEAFLDEGVDEQVLQELKQLWENKLAASKALEPPPEELNIAPAPSNIMMLPQPLQPAATGTQQDQGQGATAPPFQLSSAATTATLALPSGLFQQQIAAIGAGGQIQNITVQQTGNGQYITLAGLPQHLQPQLQQQLQQQQQQPRLAQQISPTHLLQQQQPQQQRIQIPQQQIQQLQQQQQQGKLLQTGQLLQPNQARLPTAQVNKAQGVLPQGLIQLDGPGDTSSSEDDDFDDDDKDEEEKEDENDEEEQGEEEEPLNSGDDVSEEDPTELFETDNVVVCQYDKINRNKNKWKFHLKDGIMNLNGRDFVFQKLTGDSEW